MQGLIDIKGASPTNRQLVVIKNRPFYFRSCFFDEKCVEWKDSNLHTTNGNTYPHTLFTKYSPLSMSTHTHTQTYTVTCTSHNNTSADSYF